MLRLSLSFFGAFQAALSGEPLVHFRSANVQGLLIYLAMQAKRPFPRESLATLFWPHDSDATAKKNLRQSLYQLRKVLGDSDKLPQPYLLVTRQTVQFNPAADFALDVAQFVAAVDKGDWQTAVSHYAGPLLPGFFCESEAFEEWLRVEREHFYRLALDAYAGAANVALQQHNLTAVQRLAQQQLAIEPWREEAHRQLMQALALAGDRSGALAQFDRCFEALMAELGIEPSEQTNALYEQIATNVILPLAAVPQTADHQLPQPPTPFIGRLAEVSHIIQTLENDHCRVLTLVGAGGVGKTRLAVEVAHQFEAQTGASAYFVSLLGMESAGDLLTAVSQLVELPPTASTLTDERVLLVLDNAEPLLASAGDDFVEQVNRLTHALPNGRLLLTSRQPLQVQREWLLPIEGLTLPPSSDDLLPQRWQQYDGLRLFVQRAQQAHAAFRVDSQNIHAITTLCQQVAGLPLAIELAAAQIRQHSLAEIVANVAALTADLRDLPPRHRSLYAVFRQSWQLLSLDEQAALHQTAVFHNGFSRAAVRVVLDEGADLIDGLVEKSLLLRHHRPQGVSRVRYSLPPALRQFLLAEQPLDVAIAERHARYYLEWAVAQRPFLPSERDNVAAAWGWAQAQPDFTPPRGWRSEWLAELAAELPAESERVQAPVLVGREAELTAVREMLAMLSRQHKNGGLTTILGEAGIGKSHLVAQLRATHAQIGQADIAWFEAPCDETSAQSLRPFRLWLRDYFNQQGDASLPIFQARFVELVQATAAADLRAELTRLQSLLAALVDLILPDSLYTRLKPEQRRENFQQAIKTLIKAESLLQPLVLHVEDAHWIDVDSRELLQSLLQHVADYPFAVLVTARPNGFEPLLLLEGRQQTIRLDVLEKTAVFQLATHHLAHEPDDDLLALLYERGQGNPFHTEQLLLYLRDNGLVAKGRLVRRIGQPLADTLLPIELNNLLVARLGQLEPGARDVVAQASVLGHEFSVRTMEAIVGEEVLRESLARGVETAVWHPISSDRYSFNHALLRDAAYTTQFDSRRRELHQQAAQAIAATATQPQFAAIAHHYDEAQEGKKAVANYLKAGDEAMENYFIREAHNYYSRGLALAETDRQKLPLYLGREAANHWLGNREQQKEDLRQLVGLTADLQDRTNQIDIELRRGAFNLVTGNYVQAIQHARRSAQDAALLDRTLEARAYHLWGRAMWQSGKPQAAAPLLKRALRLNKVAKNAIEEAKCHYDLSIIAYYRDDFVEARSQLQEAAVLFEDHGDQRNTIRCINTLGIIAHGEKKYEEALHFYQRSVDMCQATSWTFGEALMLGHLGSCYFDLGDYVSCRDLLLKALEISRIHDHKEAQSVALDTIGLTYHFEGNRQTAKQYFQASLQLATELNQLSHKAYVSTHLGILLIDLEELEQASVALYDALTYRHDIQSKGVAIDTEAALALLDVARGDVELAVERVEEIVAWIEANGLAGIELPFQVYWQCHTILKLAGMSDRARQLLQAAYGQLQTLAQAITDDNLRQRYLEHIPHHRQIIQALAA